MGVVERGALGFFYRGANVVAAAGHLNLCVPGEVHTGQPAAPAGWDYRMFYLDASVLERVAHDVADRPCGLPFFSAGVIADVPLARHLRSVHLRLEQPDTARLEQETLLLGVLAHLVRRHADAPPPTLQVGREPAAVGQIKRHLEHHYAEEVSLEALSRLTHLSRYHLVRVFSRSVGLPPHAYLRQVRISRAKALLAAGCPVAEVAVATGFTDQSHLHRWFKRLWGVTPGGYRKGVQDNSA